MDMSAFASNLASDAALEELGGAAARQELAAEYAKHGLNLESMLKQVRGTWLHTFCDSCMS